MRLRAAMNDASGITTQVAPESSLNRNYLHKIKKIVTAIYYQSILLL